MKEESREGRGVAPRWDVKPQSPPNTAAVKSWVAAKSKEIQEKLEKQNLIAKGNSKASPLSHDPKSSKLSDELKKRVENVKAQLTAKSAARSFQASDVSSSGFKDPKLNYAYGKGSSGLFALGSKNVPEYSAIFDKEPKSIDTAFNRTSLLPKSEFATVKANQRPINVPRVSQKKKELKVDWSFSEFSNPKTNPYFDPRMECMSSKAPKSRPKRSLKFIQKGKFINEANQMRAMLDMERLKIEIEKSVKKTGMNVELTLVSDKSLRHDPPPDVEWWDVQFAGSGYKEINYKDIESSSLITNLVQHPLPTRVIFEDIQPKPEPIMLTKMERKKLRRQKSLEKQRDKTDRIRLGFLPPEQPKAKIKNMMLIFKDEAIKDPTRVELDVRSQINARKQKHRDLIASQKKAAEHKKLKRKRKLDEDERVNLTRVAIFRINDLSSKRIRFVIDENAAQKYLSGVGIIYPGMNIVIVEGAQKAVKFFKKLMLRRIDWGSSRDNDEEQEEEAPEDNKCYLVWEGKVSKRQFGFFKYKNIESEFKAREFFEGMGCVHYWESVRSYNPEDFEA